MLLHIGRRMKHHDATDFDMSIFELAADLLLDELVIGYSVFILAIFTNVIYFPKYKLLLKLLSHKELYRLHCEPLTE